MTTHSRQPRFHHGYRTIVLVAFMALGAVPARAERQLLYKVNARASGMRAPQPFVVARPDLRPGDRLLRAAPAVDRRVEIEALAVHSEGRLVAWKGAELEIDGRKVALVPVSRGPSTTWTAVALAQVTAGAVPTSHSVVVTTSYVVLGTTGLQHESYVAYVTY